MNVWVEWTIGIATHVQPSVTNREASQITLAERHILNAMDYYLLSV